MKKEVEVVFKVTGDCAEGFAEFAKLLERFCNGGSSRTLGIIDPSGERESEIKWSFDGDGDTRITVTCKSGDTKKKDKESVSESVRAILGEALWDRQRPSNDMRFDVNARAEVWVTKDDIEDHREYRAIIGKGGGENAKIGALKNLALSIAREKLENGESNVTADLTLGDVNVDRIDWAALAAPSQDEE